MALQLVELALLDTNLQIQHSICRCPTHLDPFSGRLVRLLHDIGSARFDGAANDGLHSDRDGQKD
jgi:hypothetical protein